MMATPSSAAAGSNAAAISYRKPVAIQQSAAVHRLNHLSLPLLPKPYKFYVGNSIHYGCAGRCFRGVE